MAESFKRRQDFKDSKHAMKTEERDATMLIVYFENSALIVWFDQLKPAALFDI